MNICPISVKKNEYMSSKKKCVNKSCKFEEYWCLFLIKSGMTGIKIKFHLKYKLVEVE